MTEPKVRSLIELDQKLLNELDRLRPEDVELARFLGILVRLGYSTMKQLAQQNHRRHSS